MPLLLVFLGKTFGKISTMKKKNNLYTLLKYFIYLCVSLIVFTPLNGQMNLSAVSSSLFFFVVVVFLKTKHNVKFTMDYGVIGWAIVFAFFQTLNKSFALDYSLKFYQENQIAFIFQFIIGILFSYPIFELAKYLFYQNKSGNKLGVGHAQKQWNLFSNLKYWHIYLLFLVMGCVLVLFQQPINVSNDAADELMQFSSYTKLIDLNIPLNNHHPVFDTMVLGLVFKSGLRLTGDFSLSILIMSLIQTAVNATGFAFLSFKLCKSHINYFLKLIFTIMMLVSPMWVNLNATIVKDNLLIVPLIFWFYYFSKIIISRKKIQNHEWIIFAILSILVSLIRPNMFYVMILSLIALNIFSLKKVYNLKVFGVLLALTVFIFSYNHILSSSSVVPAKTVEMLSVPLQQTARTIKYNNVTLSKADLSAVNGVMDITKIQNYNPQVSDPIKGSYNWAGRNKLFTKNFKNYLPVWLKIGIKYPLSYFEATYANTFGYINILSRNSGQGEVLFSNYVTNNNFSKYFGVKQYMSLNITNKKNLLNHKFIGILHWPIFNIYHNIGMWSWVIIYIFINAFWHLKTFKKEFMIVLPSILTLGTLIMSPVNGLNRYYIPIFLMLPLIVISIQKIRIESEMDL